jgi:Holliday junction resolvase
VSWGLKRNRKQWSDGLSRTTWQDFERLLARHYREEGYEVELCGTADNASRFDGGVDLVLRRGGETVLVQCKHWKASQVPHNDVHQLLGLLETRQAQRAILVTSGEFTSAAREAASRTQRIQLIDGMALRLMVDPRHIPESTPEKAPDEAFEWAPVADKAIDAIMYVQTGGRWRKRRQTPEEALKELGLKLLLGAVVVLVVFLFIRSQLQTLQSTLVRPTGRPAAAAPAPQSQPGTSFPPRASRPVQEPQYTQPPPMTPEQLKDWERKNAEAMEIMERTTPSVYD